jgi:hypothetical protein
MYLVLFFDQANYQFITSLHSTRAAAETAYEAFLRRYVIEDGETLPPKASWGELFDRYGETPHLYTIMCDGKPAAEISLSNSEDLATA